MWVHPWHWWLHHAEVPELHQLMVRWMEIHSILSHAKAIEVRQARHLSPRINEPIEDPNQKQRQHTDRATKQFVKMVWYLSL